MRAVRTWWSDACPLLRCALVIQVVGLLAAVAFEVTFVRDLCRAICEDKQMTIGEVERANGLGIFDLILPALACTAICLARLRPIGAALVASLPIALFSVELVLATIEFARYPVAHQWLLLEMTTLAPPAFACVLAFIEAMRHLPVGRGALRTTMNDGGS